eukprot:15041965-Alexandrium_andersonii.AAC.1
MAIPTVALCRSWMEALRKWHAEQFHPEKPWADFSLRRSAACLEVKQKVRVNRRNAAVARVVMGELEHNLRVWQVHPSKRQGKQKRG